MQQMHWKSKVKSESLMLELGAEDVRYTKLAAGLV